LEAIKSCVQLGKQIEFIFTVEFPRIKSNKGNKPLMKANRELLENPNKLVDEFVVFITGNIDLFNNLNEKN